MQSILLNTSQHEQALRWWGRTGSASASQHADVDGVSKRNELQQMQGTVTGQNWCKSDQHCCCECCLRRCMYLCKHALRPGSDTLNGDLAETLNSASFLCMQDVQSAYMERLRTKDVELHIGAHVSRVDWFDVCFAALARQLC